MNVNNDFISGLENDINGSKESVFFSKWIKHNCPSSWNHDKNIMQFNVSDIDFVLLNEITRKFCILEVKDVIYPLKDTQRKIYNLIHKRLTEGEKICFDNHEYIGAFFVQFDYNGKFWLNRKEITELELIEKLSLL